MAAGETSLGHVSPGGPDLPRELAPLLERLFDAWNRRDAAAFAGLFTEHADYVTGDGRWLRGRNAVSGLVRTTARGPRASMRGAPAFRASGSVVTAVFRWEAGPERGVTTCIFVEDRGGWRIDRLHNTDERATDR